MKITVFGCGYVGLVTGACLAEIGNKVLCIDIDKDKVDKLNSGQITTFNLVWTINLAPFVIFE